MVLGGWIESLIGEKAQEKETKGVCRFYGFGEGITVNIYDVLEV